VSHEQEDTETKLLVLWVWEWSGVLQTNKKIQICDYGFRIW